MFDKMKALMDMQRKMQDIKRQLENTVFEAESSNGLVKITMNGSQEIKDVKINGDLKTMESLSLEQAIKDSLFKAIKKSQTVAADKMKEVTGMNLPGVT
ncbi:MAG: YbaB/EbfC family nucleoid-associated protein [Candidatus Omnitrophica bacterium]|nr:YbaB/EbfC family nucleoid-associated protein [Candidatus Omnitrophota bacterium]